ncbi:MAG: GNAT family N-acetyltransferase [Eubacteriales bacterium]|nr:GNAT family N-acetyltransferase [Eubacteriales bacterium]
MDNIKMEKVESVKQFGDMVKEFKRKYKPVQSNCYLMPGEVDSMIRNGSLYFGRSEKGLYFQVKETGCYRLYYYLSSDCRPAITKQDRCVILDYVFRGNEEIGLAKAGCDKWEQAGFRPYKRYLRMECLRGNFIPPEDQREKESKYPVVPMTAEDYPAVLALWEGSLDGYSTPFLNEDEFDAECKNRRIVGMRLPDGSAGAVAVSIQKGRTCFLQHLVVSPKFRGLGMGRTLHSAVVEVAFGKENTDKVNFWVDEKIKGLLTFIRDQGLYATA